MEAVLEIVSGKWKARILYLLSQDAHTFAELRHSLPGIKQQVLATQLKALCRDGIVSRLKTLAGAHSYSLYSLTKEGESLVSVLQSVAAWGENRLKVRGQEWQPPLAKHLLAPAGGAYRRCPQ